MVVNCRGALAVLGSGRRESRLPAGPGAASVANPRLPRRTTRDGRPRLKSPRPASPPRAGAKRQWKRHRVSEDGVAVATCKPRHDRATVHRAGGRGRAGGVRSAVRHGWCGRSLSEPFSRSRRRLVGRGTRRELAAIAGLLPERPTQNPRPTNPVPPGCPKERAQRCCSACRYSRYRLRVAPRRACHLAGNAKAKVAPTGSLGGLGCRLQPHRVPVERRLRSPTPDGPCRRPRSVGAPTAH
jgi:hypothetical protein